MILALMLSAYTFSTWNGEDNNQACSQSTNVIEPPTFFYNLSAGTNNTISKERMHNAKTVADLFPDYQMQEDVKNKRTVLREVKIRVAAEHGHCSKGTAELKSGTKFSEEQVNLLQSTDYSTNFNLEGYAVPNTIIPDLNNKRHFNYSMTVVPENQASYKGGNEAFIDFLTAQCQPTIAKTKRGNLKSGNISFNVTKSGSISDVKIISTCGYPSVDKRMMDLMNELPQGWNIATNNDGEKLDQTLVFSYGQGGC